MYYKNIENSLGHTPLVELSRLAPNDRVRIFAKLEGQNPGGSGSVKDRIVKAMVEAAEKSGALKPGMKLVEATSGNTGISLAWLGRLKGYAVTIVMPESMSVERRRLIQIMGAKLVLTPGELGMNGAIAKARELAAEKGYFNPDQFSNPANPETHYRYTAGEILAELPAGKPDYLVCTVGTGGTIVGLSQRFKQIYPSITVVGVEPPADDPIQGLRCVDDSNMPAIMDFRHVDQRKIVTSAEAEEYARKLLEVEGIFAGISSGAAACQTVKTAREISEGSVITILADAGWKYLSLDYWNGR